MLKRITGLYAIGCLFMLLSGGNCCGQEFSDLSFVELEKQLNAILKTRRDEEKAYVARIVLLVKEEAIPRQLVNASFKYVINKRPGTKYPFVYFVRVLQFLGARDEIEIPAFDFRIYSTPVRQ